MLDFHFRLQNEPLDMIEYLACYDLVSWYLLWLNIWLSATIEYHDSTELILFLDLTYLVLFFDSGQLVTFFDSTQLVPFFDPT